MSMEIAVNAALYGPEKKKLKVFDHEFNVKPAEISRKGTRTNVSGQISHHLTARIDDQLYYTIFLEQAVLKDIQQKIARGGGTLIAAPIVSGVAAYFGKAVSPEQVASVGQAIGRLYDGGWESAAELIIANIAAAVSAEESSKMPTAPKEDVFKLENLESKAWIISNSDGRFGTYRGDDYADQYWKVIEGTGVYSGSFKLENLESKAWIISNSDGRFGTYRGDDYADQYWRKILKV